MKKKIAYFALLGLLVSSTAFAKLISTTDLVNKDSIFYEKNHSQPFTGEAIERGLTGKITTQTHYKNGLQNGPSKNYFSNGQLLISANYKDGKLNGPYKSYYENGKLQMEATYKDDKIVGLYKTYYESGKISEVTIYKNGAPTSNSKQYYENGKLK